MLQGLVAATDDPADRDAVSYWSDWPSRGPASFSDVRWNWAQTASYANANGLPHFDDMAAAAQLASVRAVHGRVSFQSHVMSVDDFLTMWVTEFGLHHLDLIRHLDHQPRPSDDVLHVVVSTLQKLTKSTDLEDWDELTFVRKAAGREALSATDLERLGERGSRFPALG